MPIETCIKNSYPTYLVLNPLTNAAYCAHETETEEKVFAMETLLLESLLRVHRRSSSEKSPEL